MERYEINKYEESFKQKIRDLKEALHIDNSRIELEKLNKTKERFAFNYVHVGVNSSGEGSMFSFVCLPRFSSVKLFCYRYLL